VRPLACLAILSLSVCLFVGCPKKNEDFDEGRKAEALMDYDTALVHYERALRADPMNTEYRLRTLHMRSEASNHHLEQGEKAKQSGDLQLALAEFEKARSIDPSDSAADQEIHKTMLDIAATASAKSASPLNLNPDDDEQLLAAPPDLKPLSLAPINLKMTNDSRVAFETIAKLAGLSVIFDPDYTSRRISVELPNVTLEEALDDVSLEGKAFWKPLSTNVVFVAPDNPQKRRDFEEEEVRVFYLSNTLTSQDLTEIVTGLRQLLDLRRLSQVNAQNAIVIRDTPDKLMLASKIIRDIDKAKPEVLIHVQVLSADRDRLRDLGINPGTSVALTFNPRCAVEPNSTTTDGVCTSSSTTSTTTTTTVGQITLNNLRNLSTQDYSLTLPSAVADAVLTDDKTTVIQDPEVRVSDGAKASLKIGERVPVATGSFEAGVTATTTTVSPLVNTQFQYIDVGVNIDVMPRVHPDGDVSMKLTVDISSIAGESDIGGIEQPVIAQHKIEHDIRLKDGEVSVLGGLIERDETTNRTGIPGISQIPFARYFASDNSHELNDQELLIVLTPHVIRFPSISEDDLRTLAAGTDSNTRVYREDESAGTSPPTGTPEMRFAAPRDQIPQGPEPATAASLNFEPAVAQLKPGETAAIAVTVSNVSDLYSIPLLIHFDPNVVQVQEIHDGGFLSGGTQQIAIVQQIDAQKGEVVVSAARQPNTPGVNGSGTLLGIIVRAVARGNSPLQIPEVTARDSHQNIIRLMPAEGSIRVN